MVWLPELPPIPATIGISAASATSRSIEPSKAPITREAINAVTRFTASQAQRFLKLFHTGANTSSSFDRPASAAAFAGDRRRRQVIALEGLRRVLRRIFGMELHALGHHDLTHFALEIRDDEPGERQRSLQALLAIDHEQLIG